MITGRGVVITGRGVVMTGLMVVGAAVRGTVGLGVVGLAVVTLTVGLGVIITFGVVTTTLGGKVKGFDGVGYLYPSNLVVVSITLLGVVLIGRKVVGGALGVVTGALGVVGCGRGVVTI